MAEPLYCGVGWRCSHYVPLRGGGGIDAGQTAEKQSGHSETDFYLNVFAVIVRQMKISESHADAAAKV